MKRLGLLLKVSILLVGLIVLALAATASAATSAGKSPVMPLHAAGDIGGGVLVPGTLFPPTNRGFGTLQRGSDWVQTEIHTSGLPAGAYTVWWAITSQDPDCGNPCNEAPVLSVFWATGGVVQNNGIGNFSARYTAGDYLGEPGAQHLNGDGTLNPMTATVVNIIKYHGPASNDADVLYEQTHTVLGSCFENANAIIEEPFGVNCFNPQIVVHAP